MKEQKRHATRAWKTRALLQPTCPACAGIGIEGSCEGSSVADMGCDAAICGEHTDL